MPQTQTLPRTAIALDQIAPPRDIPAEPHLDVKSAVTGNLTGRTITVHRGALVEGRLDATTVVIHGTVRGSVAAGSVSVGGTGRIEGELRYQALTVSPGAVIEANCIPSRRSPRPARS